MLNTTRDIFICRILSVSISFDLNLFNGQSTRQPGVDQLIDDLCKQLDQAIEICERTTLSEMMNILGLNSSGVFLVNISDENVEINIEARQAMNLIETGTLSTHIHSLFSFSDSNAWSILPLVSSTNQTIHHSSLVLRTFIKCISRFVSLVIKFSSVRSKVLQLMTKLSKRN